MAISAAFNRPFDEQVAFFRGKLGNLIPTERWTDVWKSAHDTGFMVAGAAKADLLADLASAVDQAISEGTGIDAFRKQFSGIVEKHGWSYRGEYNWRTRTIYRTNMTTSYAAGRLAQLKEGDFPFWMYRHSDAVARPRPLHLSWDKLVLPAEDPWWQTHYPPNGWGCQCYVIGVSRKTAERFGGRITTPPDDGAAPDGTPNGIDRGWDYQPGGTTADQVRRGMSEKLKSLPPAIAEGLQRDLAAVETGALPAWVEAKSVKDAERFCRNILAAPGGVPYMTADDGRALVRYKHGRTPSSEVPGKLYGQASFTGMDLDTANHVNRVLLEMQAECDRLGIPRLRGVKTGAGRALASMGDGVLSFSRHLTVNPVGNLKTSTAKAGDALATKPHTTEAYFTDPLDRVRTTLWHEFAHHIHQQFKVTNALEYRVSPPLEKALAAFTRARHGSLVIPSRYAATNSKEFFAESYNLYKLGREDLIDPEIVALIRKLERGELP